MPFDHNSSFIYKVHIETDTIECRETLFSNILFKALTGGLFQSSFEFFSVPSQAAIENDHAYISISNKYLIPCGGSRGGGGGKESSVDYLTSKESLKFYFGIYRKVMSSYVMKLAMPDEMLKAALNKRVLPGRDRSAPSS